MQPYHPVALCWLPRVEGKNNLICSLIDKEGHTDDGLVHWVPRFPFIPGGSQEVGFPSSVYAVANSSRREKRVCWVARR